MKCFEIFPKQNTKLKPQAQTFIFLLTLRATGPGSCGFIYGDTRDHEKEGYGITTLLGHKSDIFIHRLESPDAGWRNHLQ